MTVPDLGAAAACTAALVSAVPEDALGLPTPCPAYRVGDLLEHIGGLALAFAAAAGKDAGKLTAQAPAGDVARLPTDWRTRIPADLRELALAWRDPAAWTGMTRVGGVDLPGDAAGIFALDEVVVHGWDLAVATSQPYLGQPYLGQPDPGQQPYPGDAAALEALTGFLGEMATPGREAARKGLFGPPVEVPQGAPLLDKIIALTGRDPAWTADSPARSAGRP